MEAQTKEDEVFAGLLGERKRKKKMGWNEGWKKVEITIVCLAVQKDG